MKVIVAVRGREVSAAKRPLRHPDCVFEEFQLNHGLFAWAWVITVQDIEELVRIVRQNSFPGRRRVDEQRTYQGHFSVHVMLAMPDMLIAWIYDGDDDPIADTECTTNWTVRREPSIPD